MKRLVFPLTVLMLAGCATGEQAATCRDYAADVETLVASGASAEELERFLQSTEENVAQLMARDKSGAQECADAVFTVLFSATIEEFDAEIERALTEVDR